MVVKLYISLVSASNEVSSKKNNGDMCRGYVYWKV